jgi:predicted TPR repeat methyltransferase
MAKKWLKIVYSEKNPTKLKLHYKSWAKEYDKDLTDWGYAYPKRLKEIILSKKIKISKKANILDAGCGTGLVAEELSKLDYKNLTGLDNSKEMLELAKSKKIFKKLICQSLNKKTTLKSNQFDLIICTGVLTAGHVGPGAIKELLRLTKKNGYLILSISETIFKKLGFDTELAYRSNEYTSLHVSRPFLALPHHDSSAKNKIYILRKS